MECAFPAHVNSGRGERELTTQRRKGVKMPLTILINREQLKGEGVRLPDRDSQEFHSFGRERMPIMWVTT